MQILIKPILSEKASASNENGLYAFVVNKKANKIQIKQAVESLYGVNVVSVRTINVAGKSKTRFTKAGMIEGRTRSYKKAYIALADGEMLDIYEGTEEGME